MTNHPGWYPPGQVCFPPELPTSFKNVYTLKPIVGVPSDEEVIGIHAVIHAANRISGVPGMHDPGLFMRLSDHLFNVQMAKYRSKYSLIVFPSDTSFTPPALPAHFSVSLEVVAGAPSDEEIIKVQDAVRAYQHFSSVPSMFDPRVNMELSQHLFDIQMARYMRHAGETQPNLESQTTVKHEVQAQTTNRPLNTNDETVNSTNNAGTGGTAVGADQAPHSGFAIDVRDLMERSNQLAERFNQLLERSNLPTNQSNQLTERFSQALDRFTQLVEKVHMPVEASDQPINRFNQLFERFNQVLSELGQTMQKSNQLAERLNQIVEGFTEPLRRTNELSENANQLAEQHNQSSQRSNDLAEQANEPLERLENVMKNINRVLVGIQHAIVRNYKGNTMNAVECLVNEKGETPASSKTTGYYTFERLSRIHASNRLLVMIGGAPNNQRFFPGGMLAGFLRFYGIWGGLCDNEHSSSVKSGKVDEARER